MHDLPGSLRLASTFPFVGRAAELETLRTLLAHAPHGEGRRAVLVGGEAGSGKSRLVREFGPRGSPPTACSSSTGPATRWSARRTGPSSRRSSELVRTVDSDELRAALGPRRRRAGEAGPGSPGAGSRPAAGGRGRSRHRAPPPAHRGHRPARRGERGPSGRSWCSRTATGPTRRRCCCCATWRGRRASARVLLLATFRDTERRRLRAARRDARRPAALRRTSSACTSTGSRTRRSTEFVRARPAAAREPGRRSSRRTITDLTGGNPFLRLRALARARGDRDGRDRRRQRRGSTARPAELGTPESVREVVSQRLARLAPPTTDLLELAATAGAEFELATIRPAARARGCRAARPPSTRRCAAG